MQVIDDAADLEIRADRLLRAHPGFAPARAAIGALTPRRREGGFAGLFFIILGQQVSVASARATWARVEAAGLHRAGAVLAAPDEALRACGLSRQKIVYARQIAQAEAGLDALPGLEDADVIARLTALKGIGRWTAEIYAMFSLGRADIFPAGDLALQEAARVLFALPERPAERSLREMAADWAPERTVAATMLWQYYAYLKSREGVA